MKSKPGTYMLLLDLPHRCEVEFGRSGRADLERGLYCYVGSALGPGGLAARLGRHARAVKRKHWHVDYLLPRGRLAGALVAEGKKRIECSWASWIRRGGGSSIDGFGASDCSCEGHLFHLGAARNKGSFVARARKDLDVRLLTRRELIHGYADAGCSKGRMESPGR